MPQRLSASQIFRRRRRRDRNPSCGHKLLSTKRDRSANPMAEGAIERFRPRGGLPPPSQATSPNGVFFPGRGDLARDRRPFPPSGASGGDFRMESLNPSADPRGQASRSGGPVSSAAASSSSGVLGRKSDGGVFRPRGSDPEISFGITFRRIVSAPLWRDFLVQGLSTE